MSLNPLKRIVKSAFNHDPLQQIFWGQPTAESYHKVIQNFRTMSVNEKQQTMNRILKKMQKPKQSDLVIANLILLHKIMKINPVYFSQRQPLIQESKKKQFAGEKNFIKFYYQFLKMTKIQLMNKKQTIEQVIEYCEISLTKSFQIIKNNIVIEYCLNHSSNQINLRIALKQIFQDIRNDLLFTTDVIQKNAKIIYLQHNTNSFALNQVYQKLIQLNKSMTKISVLIKKAALSINLPIYQFNRDLNMKIQMQMNLRKDEKIKFKTEKRISSQKNIQVYEHETMKNISYLNSPLYSNNYIQLSEIQQDQIMMQHCEEIF